MCVLFKILNQFRLLSLRWSPGHLCISVRVVGHVNNCHFGIIIIIIKLSLLFACLIFNTSIPYYSIPTIHYATWLVVSFRLNDGRIRFPMLDCRYRVLNYIFESIRIRYIGVLNQASSGSSHCSRHHHLSVCIRSLSVGTPSQYIVSANKNSCLVLRATNAVMSFCSKLLT